MKVIYAYGDTRSQHLGEVPEVIVIDDDMPDLDHVDDSFDMLNHLVKGELPLPKGLCRNI